MQGSKLDQFDWTLWNGSTPSRNTGPTNDHTLGTSKGDSRVNNTRDKGSKTDTLAFEIARVFSLFYPLLKSIFSSQVFMPT